MKFFSQRFALVLLGALSISSLTVVSAQADETRNSPYVSHLIKGQEHFVHVWTLGIRGLGDGADKLVTVDVDPASRQFGKVIHSISVGGRGEVHHTGFTDDRKYLWAGRLDDSKIFVFDVGTNPGEPKLVNTITNFEHKTGFVGPHIFYALPGRMLIGALSNAKNRGGRTAMAIYNNRGHFMGAHNMPVNKREIGGGYSYDIAINPQKNAMLTSSFTGKTNYMMDFDVMLSDPNAMKNFGNKMVLWDLKAMQPRKVFDVPGAPLEIRWVLGGKENWAITATPLTSKLWLIKQSTNGAWHAKEVASIGDQTKIPLPIDISIRADGKGLWVNTFMDGKTRFFDISNPEKPKQIYEKKVGKQVNIVSQSWDGKRIYVTSSLTANWDKKIEKNEQFLKAFKWDGKQLHLIFELDFIKLGLGRAQHMKFTARPIKDGPKVALTNDASNVNKVMLASR